MFFGQTSPLPPTVPCPGDRLLLTCITDSGVIVWRSTTGAVTQVLGPTVQGNFSLNIANMNGNTITSTATAESVPVSLTGAIVGCSDTFPGGFVNLMINVSGQTIRSMCMCAIICIIGPPVAVNDVTHNPVNSTSLNINWSYQQELEHCIHFYNITVTCTSTSNGTTNVAITTNTTNITILDLIIGSNYSFIIIPNDTVGREGPPSSLIQYIWNGMNYTVYILIVSTHCISYSTSSSC